MYQVVGNEELYIIKITLSDAYEGFSVYAIYIDGERPIYFNNKPIFFFKLADVRKAIKQSNCGAEKIYNLPTEVCYDYHFKEILDILSNENIASVEDAQLLNCLQLLLDYCFDTMDFWTDAKKARDASPSCSGDEYMVPVSPRQHIKPEYDYVQIIFSASQYFFTERKINGFFEIDGYSRKDLVKAIKYIIGHIAVNSVYIA